MHPTKLPPPTGVTLHEFLERFTAASNGDWLADIVAFAAACSAAVLQTFPFPAGVKHSVSVVALVENPFESKHIFFEGSRCREAVKAAAASAEVHQ